MASLRLFIITILYISFVLGDNICYDSDCTKRGAISSYPAFIKGIDDTVASSDPLIVNSINADSDKLKYRLQDAVLIGMKDCFFVTMTIEQQNRTFQFDLHCPYIESTSQYVMSGYIGTKFFEGEGSTTIIAEDYVFKFNGVYERKKGQDNKYHGVIKSYVLDIDPKGKVTFNFKNLFGNDKEKGEAGIKYINENWQVADKELGAHIHAFMKKFIDNLNDFLNLVGSEEVFHKHE